MSVGIALGQGLAWRAQLVAVIVAARQIIALFAHAHLHVEVLNVISILKLDVILGLRGRPLLVIIIHIYLFIYKN